MTLPEKIFRDSVQDEDIETRAIFRVLHASAPDDAILRVGEVCVDGIPVGAASINRRHLGGEQIGFHQFNGDKATPLDVHVLYDPTTGNIETTGTLSSSSPANILGVLAVAEIDWQPKTTTFGNLKQTE